MKNKISSVLRFIYMCLLGTFILQGCKKEETLVIPEAVAHFTNLEASSYFVTGPSVTYKIPVGVSTVSNVDRTISFTVSSPTGAVAGTHYTLDKTTVTIPAGKAIDSIEVRGIYNQYATSGRKDSLIFTLKEPSLKAAPYNSTYRLYMRGPCFEGDMVLAELLGNYKNTIETLGTDPPYGPYTTTINKVTQISPTKGTIVVANIWDNGWNPITFTLDWTNPSNRTATLIEQSGIGDGGTLNPAYAGMDISVRPFAGQVGTFSYCKGTLQLKMQIGITGLGYINLLYTVNMAR